MTEQRFVPKSPQNDVRPLLHDLVEKLLIGFDGDADERDGVYCATEALADVIDEYLSVNGIDVLRLQPGDVVHLRMGDPHVGWIPAPEVSEKLALAFRDALDQVGHDDVPVIYSHYGCRPEIIRREKEPSDG